MITDAMVARHLREPDEMYWTNVTMAVINGGSIRSSVNQGTSHDPVGYETSVCVT